MRFLRALLGIRYFNIHVEGTRDDGDRITIDATNIPERQLSALTNAIMEWDLKGLSIKVDVA